MKITWIRKLLNLNYVRYVTLPIQTKTLFQSLFDTLYILFWFIHPLSKWYAVAGCWYQTWSSSVMILGLSSVVEKPDVKYLGWKFWTLLLHKFVNVKFKKVNTYINYDNNTQWAFIRFSTRAKRQILVHIKGAIYL